MEVLASDSVINGQRISHRSSEQNPFSAYESIHRYLLARQFAVGKRVLDIARAESLGTKILAEVATSVIRIDSNSRAVAPTGHQHDVPNAHVFLADAPNFALSPGTSDLVVSFETTEHLDDREGRLASIKSALAADGLLLIATLNQEESSPDEQSSDSFEAHGLGRDEFTRLLGRYFKNVRLVGQKVIASSFLSPIDPGFLCTGGPVRFVAAEVPAPRTASPTQVQSDIVPRYYVALCSDADLPDVESSLLVDTQGALARLLTGSAQQVAQETERLWQTYEGQQAHLDHVTQLLSAVLEREQRISASLLSAHTQLANRDSEVHRFSAEKEAVLAEAKQYAQHLTEMIEGKEAALARAEQYIRQLTEAIAGKDAALAEAERYTRQLIEAIAGKDAALTEAEKYAHQLLEEIASRDAALAEANRPRHQLDAEDAREEAAIVASEQAI